MNEVRRASLTGGSRTGWWSSMRRSRFVVFPSREGEKWSGGGQEGGSHGCRFRPARRTFCVFNSSTDVGTG
jgi:hypothetical protein